MRAKIEAEIFALIESFCGSIPSEQLQDMKDLNSAGEPGVAFENLCTQLFECDVEVDKYRLAEFCKVGLEMGIQPKYWERLEREA